MTAPDFSRRDLLKATAAAGAGAVVLPGLAAAAAPGVAAARGVGVRGRAGVGGASRPPAKLTGRIVTPGDHDYADASLGWDQYFVHFPLVIVFAQNTQDVVNALTWAQQHNVAFRVRGGRHQLQGWSAVDNGLVIDVSELKGARIDAASLTATVGAGLNQLEAVTALAKKGLVVPTGTEGTVGVVGATIGGGLGLFTRSLGMACDFVMGAEIVVASGDGGAKVIKVDLHNHRDLLFALRGAGNGNFGIVTSLTYQVTRAPTVAFLMATWDAPYPLPRLFEEYQQTLLKNNRVGSELELHPNIAILTAALPNGSVAHVKEVLASVLSIGKPTVTTTVDNWGTIFKGFQIPPAAEPGNALFFSQFANQPFPKQAIDVVASFVKDAPTNDSNYFLCGFGGAVKRSTPPGGTAFPHRNRDALFYAEPGVAWGRPRGPRPYTFETAGEESQEHLQPVAQAWIAEFSQALRPYVNGAYFNVPNVGMLDWETAYWGSNFDRLRRIKAKYDPDNIFQYEQSIPPAFPC